MYFKSLEIENVGPLQYLNIKFPFLDEKPVPVVFVGENGSGKSIVLSHLVNSLIAAKQDVYEDVEVEKGRVFKYRSPDYISAGSTYSFSSIVFTNDAWVHEWQLRMARKQFEYHLNYPSSRKEWLEIPEEEMSSFVCSFQNNKPLVRDLFEQQCCLYFPVNRFEEPAWLNLENLKAKASYTELKHVAGYSNRNIVSTSPLKDNMNWLFDLLFDRNLFEMMTPKIEIPVKIDDSRVANMSVNLFAGYNGKSEVIYTSVLQVLGILLRSDRNLRLGVGPRKNRQISVIRDEQPWIPNLFQLSTGETQLLNFFLSVIRDYDLSSGELSTISDITGIIIIDEIDAHLHTGLQKDVLPTLMGYFPKVQFIITSHSPLFLLGMEEQFGPDGFHIYNLPVGERVAASDFSEFTAAYEAFKETTRHRAEIKREIEQNSKPIVFVEGDYDVRYLTKAAEFLGKKEILNRIKLNDCDGFGNLDKIWRQYDNNMSGVISGRLLLLYDCDTNKKDSDKNRIFKRIIPSVAENPIDVGIENLLAGQTVEKLEAANPRFIDIQEATTKRVRGEMELIPAKKFVNKDEKGNICNWLCQHGTKDDFIAFAAVFKIIEDFLSH